MKQFTCKQFVCITALSILLSSGSAVAASKPNDIPDGMGVLPASAPTPANNPMSAAKVELGKKLYLDPALSKSGNISCNSCHNLGSWE
ncbi:MAG: cytochrome c peroxidase [Mariprofundales bacterium]|nr:cytochrome c peroxidase [Mariprofundales bacterium]